MRSVHLRGQEVPSSPSHSVGSGSWWSGSTCPTISFRTRATDGSPTQTRYQVSGAKSFNGGEGCHYAENTVWFTTKGDNRVWQVNLTSNTYELAYDDNLVSPGSAPLTGVDNAFAAWRRTHA